MKFLAVQRGPYVSGRGPNDQLLLTPSVGTHWAFSVSAVFVVVVRVNHVVSMDIIDGDSVYRHGTHAATECQNARRNTLLSYQRSLFSVSIINKKHKTRVVPMNGSVYVTPQNI